jgi:hypothetical protein
MSNSVLGAHQNNKRINFPTGTKRRKIKNKNGENRLMMINEGAIRASNCNPISFQTLPTICGLLTRNGGGCPPLFYFLHFSKNGRSASGQLRSQQLSLLFSLCLPVCLLAVHVPLSTNLTPKKHIQTESVILWCVYPLFLFLLLGVPPHVDRRCCFLSF